MRPRDPSEAERLLDEAIEMTFPASDPIAVEAAFHRIAGHPEKERTAPGEIRPQADRKPR